MSIYTNNIDSFMKVNNALGIIFNNEKFNVLTKTKSSNGYILTFTNGKIILTITSNINKNINNKINWQYHIDYNN